ncbi:serine/arginine repetitive matrix protein 1-like [Phoenix dactylifera]|uniref:Serine/arginine repetitive matrix protein 1-like n=1 Tax=Phoenix dactylifera TaxID=42345 RepID=A0A8B7CUK6_PHODC|nr:serine/arginine repetitive matrix protein 1-like [Phoenix dactylifera]
MDFGSPDKSLEETSKEEGPPYIGELDLNLLGNKDEKGGKSFQDETEALDDNMQGHAYQEQAGSPLLPGNSAVLSSSSKKAEESCLPIEPDMQDDNMERKISDYTDEGLMSTVEDYENHDKMQGADHVDISGEQLDTSVNKLSNEPERRDSYPCFDKPVLSADQNDNSYEEVDNGTYDYQSAKSPSLIATENGDVGNISGDSQSGKFELSNEEMDHENFSHDTKMKEGDYPEEMVASDNSGMVRECSGLHSPKMRNGTSSPERNLSDSMERSPYSKPSARQEPLPPKNNDKKSTPSPSPSKRKHSPSPEKHGVGPKRASSHDCLSPPVRQRSPPGRPARRDSHHRDDSPRKRLSVSPRRRDSQRRRDRSASRSPVRRRDSSRSRRDHHGKSRSRSPYARDRYQRSPRRRHSPRRRSPPPSYYSRRRSPKRPWSPPPNRNTGIGRPGRNLFVAGFSYVTTERDLEKKFSRFGRVTDVRIVRDKRSGDSRGFGFLSLERDEDADAAIRALDQTEWNGRIVLVEKSKTSAR